jgi:hypothetical protein
MGTVRQVPGFHKKDRFEVLGLAGLFPLLGGFFCCYITISIPKHTFSDWFSTLLYLLMGTGLLLTAIYLFSRATTMFRETRNWFKNTATVQATIVDRHEVQNSSEDIDYAYSYGQYIPSGYWYLTLKFDPSKSGIAPEETLVSVAINESQYKRYAGRTSVTISYSTSDPLVFLLEDEV